MCSNVTLYYQNLMYDSTAICLCMYVCTYNSALLQEALYILMYICMYHTYVGVHISLQYLHIHIMYTSACLVSVVVSAYSWLAHSLTQSLVHCVNQYYQEVPLIRSTDLVCPFSRCDVYI